MKYTPAGAQTGVSADDAKDSAVYAMLEPVAKGLGLAILELSVFRTKSRGTGSVQVKVTIYREGNMGTDDCSRFHKAIVPRLELAFPGSELSLEVSTPGIGRLIKDGAEMTHFLGRGVKCYSTGPAETDGSGWISGVLFAADEKGIILDTGDKKITLNYGDIAKAKLDESVSINKKIAVGG